jgi:hypothetical protein
VQESAQAHPIPPAACRGITFEKLREETVNLFDPEMAQLDLGLILSTIPFPDGSVCTVSDGESREF